MAKRTVDGEEVKRASEVASAIDGLGQAVGSVGRALWDLSEVMEKVVVKLDAISVSIAGLETGRPGGSDKPASSEPRNTRRTVSTPTGRSTVGGPRKASISKGVDNLISSGWLVRKSQDEIVEKLQERYPGANADNVLHVLKRRLNRSLVRVKLNTGWGWSITETK